jgi:ketosteroid isomerase-like protein
MVALYEPNAVLDCGDGQLREGREAIRTFFAEQVAMGKKFAFGAQRPAIINGDLALTSTRLPDGSVTSEVARRQLDGTWLWVIDKFSVD